MSDVLGSCVFNLLILALLDAVYRKGSIFTESRNGHLVIAAYDIMGWPSLVLVAIYLLNSYALY